MKSNNRLPVLIGVARTTDKNFQSTPSHGLADVLTKALEDAVTTPEARRKLAQSFTDVVTIRMATEDIFKEGLNCEPYKNLAQQVAKMSGIDNDKQHYFATSSGGSTPQMLINHFAERITKGESDCVAMVGGEYLACFRKLVMEKQNLPDWGGKYEENLVTKPVEAMLGKKAGDATGTTKLEHKNGLSRPVQMYPLLEQAYRTERRDTIKSNIERNARTFDKFNEVAATQEAKRAWFPKRRSAKEIATETPANRWVAFPYPKFMNAVMEVNQSAAVIMVSEELAEKLGVPKDKRVYLRGCADAIEPGYFVSLRSRLGTSHAMVECIDSALKQAKCTPADLKLFDLYSCFPIAVNVAADFLGINPETDPRPLTVTGGLPYYGGPGNAYVSCSIAAMVEQLRQRPVEDLGLVTANGWFLTKHSCGIYSRTPPLDGVFVREDPKLCQARADKRAGPLVDVSEKPSGAGTIETYIVDFSSKGEPKVIALGRLTDGKEAGKRFIATLAAEEDQSQWMRKDGVGLTVRVRSDDSGKATFAPVDAAHWARQPDSGVPVRKDLFPPKSANL